MNKMTMMILSMMFLVSCSSGSLSNSKKTEGKQIDMNRIIDANRFYSERD